MGIADFSSDQSAHSSFTKNWRKLSRSISRRSRRADQRLAFHPLFILDDIKLGRGFFGLLFNYAFLFPQTQPQWILFVLGAAAFGGAIPALPGGVGTFEGAVSGALFLFTGDQSTSLAVALTARLYNYLNSGVIGTIGLAREGQTLSGVYQQLMNLRNKPQAEESKQP